MSDDAEIQVTVTANVAGLTAPMAQASTAAKAAFDGMRVSAADFAKALEAAGGDLRKVSIDATGAAAAAKATAASMTEAAAATSAAGAASSAAAATMGSAEAAATGLGHGAAGITRELIVLGGEAVRGNFSRIPGSLLVLTNRMNLLSLATLGPAAGIAAVVAAIGLFIVRAAEAENSLGRLQVAFEFQGVDASRDQIDSLRDTIHKLPGATQQDAEDVVRGFAQMHSASLPEIEGLARSVGDYATATGLSAKEAGAALKRAFEDPLTGGGKLFATLGHVSDATRLQYETARTSGDENAAAAAMQRALNEALGNTTTALAEQQSSWSYSLYNMLSYIGAAEGGLTTQEAQTDLITQNTAALNANAAARRAAASALANTPPTPAAILQTGVEAGARENTSRSEIQRVQGDIAQITAALGVAKSQANQVRMTQLGEDLTAAKEKLDTLQNGPVGSRQSAALDAILVKVTANARTTQQLEQEKAEATIKFWSDAAAAVTGTDAKSNEQRTSDLAKANEERLRLSATTIRTETAGAKRSAEEQWQAYKAGVNEQLAEQKGHFDKMKEIVADYVATAKRLYGEDSAAFREAKEKQAQVSTESGQADLRALEQRLNTARSIANAEANLASIGSKSSVGEFKPSIGLAFDSADLDAKVAAQVALLRSRLDIELQGLQQHMRGELDIGQTVAASADYERATAALKTFAEEAAQLNQQAAQAVAESWQQVEAPVEGAFSRIVGAAVGGGKNSAHAMEAAAVSVVQSWAKSGITMLAHWVATQLGMTAATTAGSTARIVAASPEEAQLIAQLAAMLGKHVSVETAKTSATAAAAAARTASESAAAAAGVAAQTASNVATISGDAGVAAAGAYAATAAIPLVGPALAPAAAAEAFAAVMSFSVASAEGGWGQVPFDDYPALLHQDEMVLPAPIARTVRDMASSSAESYGPRVGATGGIGDLRGSTTTVNNGGDSSHTFSYSPTIHANGGDVQSVRAALRDDRESLNAQAQHWYGNRGTPTLPGRKVHV